MAPGGISVPIRRKIRPSSAAAKLQSHQKFTTSLYGDSHVARPATAGPATRSQGTLNRGVSRPTSDTPPTGNDEAKIITKRRLTVADVEGIADSDVAYRIKVPQHNLGQILKGQIEEQINIGTLQKLKEKYDEVDTNGNHKLELNEFKNLIKSQLNIPLSKQGQIDALFQKIDWSSDGAVTWDEFCTYMQLEYAERDDSEARARDVAFHLPARVRAMPHREPVLRMLDTADGCMMACSQDGMVTFWSAGMDIKRSRSVVTAESTARSKPKWITDFILMPNYNKIIVGTGDREIQFFELSSFEPYCQINNLETVPLKLHYSPTNEDECLIVFGDGQGCVNILVFTKTGECLRIWKKEAPKAEGIASISIDQIAYGPYVKFIRWRVHDDWVQQVRYYHSLRQVISCSNHANTALVIGCTVGSTHVEQQLRELRDNPASQDRQRQRNQPTWAQAKRRLSSDQAVFKIYKGVKCFDFSKKKNIIVTGGMDRILRLWNPYVPGKATGLLRGHSAPIFYLFIAEEENRIFSISTDKAIKVWDIHDQSCLLTIRPKSHAIRGELQACHYSTVNHTLAIATDHMNAISLKISPVSRAEIAITHKEPIHACIYNPCFKQVITCCENSIIKVWDFETGHSIFEYGEAHGDNAITCMAFDTTSKRLITGGRDGNVRVWNYNNGHCLRKMQKVSDNEEICGLTYVEMNKNRYIISVGWDKRINIYADSVADVGIHHIQHPNPGWHDDLTCGHKEDILSVAQCPPNLLATGSYDGEVIVWNMVSGHIFCHLRAPPPEDMNYEPEDGDMAVNKVLFLTTRTYNKDAASLVASGPHGCITFWNVFQGGRMHAQFSASNHPGVMVTTMDVNKENSVLITADFNGFICMWNISSYGLHGIEQARPDLLITWRAHTQSITTAILIEDQKVLMTSSLDCTVRLWTPDGHYIGTFGQSEPWDIYNSATYQHPMVPYDVLVDPLSLPTVPSVEHKLNMQDEVHADSLCDLEEDEEGGDDAEQRPVSPLMTFGRQNFYVDDETIADQLKQRPFDHGKGKRLRHEKLKPVRLDRGGPNEYQMLLCYALAPTPRPVSHNDSQAEIHTAQ